MTVKTLRNLYELKIPMDVDGLFANKITNNGKHGLYLKYFKYICLIMSPRLIIFIIYRFDK